MATPRARPSLRAEPALADHRSVIRSKPDNKSGRMRRMSRRVTVRQTRKRREIVDAVTRRVYSALVATRLGTGETADVPAPSFSCHRRWRHHYMKRSPATSRAAEATLTKARASIISAIRYCGAFIAFAVNDIGYVAANSLEAAEQAFGFQHEFLETTKAPLPGRREERSP
jgi:hypothetical protein